MRLMISRMKIRWTDPSARSRLLALVASLAILTTGLLLTWGVMQNARASRAKTMLQAHVELTVTATKYAVSVYTSMLPALISARQFLLEYDAVLNTSRPLEGLLRSMTKTLAHTGLTIAAGAAFLDEERDAYEAYFSDQCARVLNVSRVPLRSILDTAWRPVNRSDVYAAVMAVGIAGSASRTEPCMFTGLDMTVSAAQSEQFLQAVDSGRLIWVPPVSSIAARPGRINFGMVAPVLAASAASAGSIGHAHVKFRQSRPDFQLPWSCAQSGPVLDAEAACGQAARALGTIAFPVYATDPLATIADVVPNVKGSILTLIYVPPELRRLVAIEPKDVWPGESPRLYNLSAEPLPDSAYLVESYAQRTTWQVVPGTLAPLLRALQPGYVLASVEYDAAVQRGGASPYIGPWKLSTPAAGLKAALAADENQAQLQAAYAFMLGPNAYLLILRDKMGVDSPHSMNAYTLNWLFGSLLSLVVAVLLPIAAVAVSWYKERRYAMQVAMLQSEKDGVVQAVAFAAHEIRNPMHGVLASLDTALADLEPLVSLLRRILKPTSKLSHTDGSPGVSSSSPPPGADNESILRDALLRALGQEQCEAALMALDDVGVARNSAESCHRLVNDMVDYSKLQKGMMSIQNSPMNVRSGLRSLLDGHRAFMHPGVRTFLKVHKDVPGTVLTDQVRILQVIANGLTNASKFTTCGEIRLACVTLDTSDLPALRLEHNPRNQWLCFIAADTGKGLAGIDVDSLFEPIMPRADIAPFDLSFSRLLCGSSSPGCVPPGKDTKGAVNTDQGAHLARQSSSSDSGAISASLVAKTRGSGLGLPVARLMARALGGDVDLYSLHNAASPHACAATVFLFVIPMDVLGLDGPIKQYPLFGRSGNLSASSRASLRMRACEASEAIRPEFHCCHMLEEVEDSPSPSRRASHHDPAHLPLNIARCTNGRDPSEGEEGPGGTELRSICGEVQKTPLADNQPQAALTTASDGFHMIRAMRRASTGDLQMSDSLPCTSRQGCVPDDVSVTMMQTPTPTDGGSSHGSSQGRKHGAGRMGESSSESIQSLHSNQPLPASNRAVSHASTIRVLYAEDDQTNRRLMERMLTRLGSSAYGPFQPRIEVTSVGDGWEALCTLYTHGHLNRGTLETAQKDGFAAEGALVLPPPVQGGGEGNDMTQVDGNGVSRGSKQAMIQPFDVILLDVDMPRFSGDQVARYVRASRLQADSSGLQAGTVAATGHVVPLIAVTGRAVELKLLQSFVRRLGAEQVEGSDSPLEVVSRLPDPALNDSFDGALGKPYRIQHLQTLMALVRQQHVGASTVSVLGSHSSGASNATRRPS